MDREHFSPSESNLLIVSIYCYVLLLDSHPQSMGVASVTGGASEKTDWLCRAGAHTCGQGLARWDWTGAVSCPLRSVPSLGLRGLQCQLFPCSFVPTDCYIRTAHPHYTCLSVTKCCLSVLSVSETVDQAIIFLKETYNNAGIQIGVIQLEA